jgi:hypothetical protein
VAQRRQERLDIVWGQVGERLPGAKEPEAIEAVVLDVDVDSSVLLFDPPAER